MPPAPEGFSDLRVGALSDPPAVGSQRAPLAGHSGAGLTRENRRVSLRDLSSLRDGHRASGDPPARGGSRRRLSRNDDLGDLGPRQASNPGSPSHHRGVPAREGSSSSQKIGLPHYNVDDGDSSGAPSPPSFSPRREASDRREAESRRSNTGGGPRPADSPPNGPPPQRDVRGAAPPPAPPAPAPAATPLDIAKSPTQPETQTVARASPGVADGGPTGGSTTAMTMRENTAASPRTDAVTPSSLMANTMPIPADVRSPGQGNVPIVSGQPTTTGDSVATSPFDPTKTQGSGGAPPPRSIPAGSASAYGSTMDGGVSSRTPNLVPAGPTRGSGSASVIATHSIPPQSAVSAMLPTATQSAAASGVNGTAGGSQVAGSPMIKGLTDRQRQERDRQERAMQKAEKRKSAAHLKIVKSTPAGRDSVIDRAMSPWRRMSQAWHKAAHRTFAPQGGQDDHEDKRVLVMPRGIMLPDSQLRRQWDWWQLIVCAYHVFWIAAIYTGGQTAKDDPGHTSHPKTGGHTTFFWWNICVEPLLSVLHCVDIFYNLRTAFLGEHEQLVTGKAEIARNYRRSLMVPDVLSMLPIYWAATIIAGRTLTDRWAILYLNRLLRMLKVGKLFDLSGAAFVDMRYVDTYYGTVPLVILIFWCAIGLHLLSCLKMVITIELDGDPAERSGGYWRAVWWIWVVLTTGPAEPGVQGPAEYVYYCIVLFLSQIMQAVLIGKIHLLIVKNDVNDQNREKMRNLLAIMGHYKVPRDMQNEALSFQSHNLQSNMENHAELLRTLPDLLRQEINLYVRLDMIAKVPMFKDLDRDLQELLANLLEEDFIEPQTDLIRNGDEGNEMYFLCYGVTEVIIEPPGKPPMVVATLRKGTFFGEIALLEECKRTATIRTVTFCEIFVLEKTPFNRLMETFPAFREAIEMEVARRAETKPPPPPPPAQSSAGEGTLLPKSPGSDSELPLVQPQPFTINGTTTIAAGAPGTRVITHALADPVESDYGSDLLDRNQTRPMPWTTNTQPLNCPDREGTGDSRAALPARRVLSAPQAQSFRVRNPLNPIPGGAQDPLPRVESLQPTRAVQQRAAAMAQELTTDPNELHPDSQQQYPDFPMVEERGLSASQAPVVPAAAVPAAAAPAAPAHPRVAHGRSCVPYSSEWELDPKSQHGTGSDLPAAAARAATQFPPPAAARAPSPSPSQRGGDGDDRPPPDGRPCPGCACVLRELPAALVPLLSALEERIVARLSRAPVALYPPEREPPSPHSPHPRPRAGSHPQKQYSDQQLSGLVTVSGNASLPRQASRGSGQGLSRERSRGSGQGLRRQHTQGSDVLGSGALGLRSGTAPHPLASPPRMDIPQAHPWDSPSPDMELRPPGVGPGARAAQPLSAPQPPLQLHASHGHFRRALAPTPDAPGPRAMLGGPLVAGMGPLSALRTADRGAGIIGMQPRRQRYAQEHGLSHAMACSLARQETSYAAGARSQQEALTFGMPERQTSAQISTGPETPGRPTTPGARGYRPPSRSDRASLK